jgi:hypothetical protein
MGTYVTAMSKRKLGQATVVFSASKHPALMPK